MLNPNLQPYDLAEILSMLRNPGLWTDLTPEDRAAQTDRLRRLAALNVGDPLRLESMLGTLPTREEFYGSLSVSTPPTTEAIDTFLTTYSKGKRLPEDAPLVTAPAIDYAAMMEQEEEKSLENLIKKRDYEAAIEIIQRENLNNPEKSIYFAEQLRFLRKLQMIETWSAQG